MIARFARHVAAISGGEFVYAGTAAARARAEAHSEERRAGRQAPRVKHPKSKAALSMKRRRR